MDNQLIKYVEEAKDLSGPMGFKEWRNKIIEYLRFIYGDETSKEFANLTFPHYDSNFYLYKGSGVGFIEGLLIKESDNASVGSLENEISKKQSGMRNNKVFIVHGHDAELKEKVARFIQNIGLIPIILHEQPNLGKTIIEKFESNSDVSYAIVLLTPDDHGNSLDNSVLNKRSRQNVILELGYFIGKLGRSNVCALKKKEVEIPSDYLGVLYIDADNEGVWKNRIAQELIQASIKIKLEGILS